MPTTIALIDTKYTTLWRIIPAIGAPVNVTSHTTELTVDSVTYVRASAQPSEKQLLENLDPSNLEIVLPLVQGGVTEAELYGGKWDSARIEVRIYDLINAVVKQTWTGKLSSVQLVNGQMKAEVLDLTSEFGQPVGDLYQENCRADHGDSACGRTPQTWSRAVLASASRQEFTVSGSFTNAQLQYGLVTGESGANSNFSMEIKSVTDNGNGTSTIQLQQSFIYTISVGDTFTLKEGCGKTFADCIARNNAKRFRGEPGIPGVYKIFKYPE